MRPASIQVCPLSSSFWCCAQTVTASESQLLRACLELEYHYSLMYSFAPASYALQHYNNATPTPSEPARRDETNSAKVAALTRLSDQASGASYQMLSIIVNLGPTNLLRYLPVRCWVFIVAAYLHLLKVSPPFSRSSVSQSQLTCRSVHRVPSLPTRTPPTPTPTSTSSAPPSPPSAAPPPMTLTWPCVTPVSSRSS